MDQPIHTSRGVRRYLVPAVASALLLGGLVIAGSGTQKLVTFPSEPRTCDLVACLSTAGSQNYVALESEQIDCSRQIVEQTGRAKNIKVYAPLERDPAVLVAFDGARHKCADLSGRAIEGVLDAAKPRFLDHLSRRGNWVPRQGHVVWTWSSRGDVYAQLGIGLFVALVGAGLLGIWSRKRRTGFPANHPRAHVGP